jgi:hypothetical protein
MIVGGTGLTASLTFTSSGTSSWASRGELT